MTGWGAGKTAEGYDTMRCRQNGSAAAEGKDGGACVRRLTVRQKAFVEAYVRLGGEDKAQAAIEAGYAPATAAAQARRLLKNPLIGEYLECLTQEVARVIKSRLILDAETAKNVLNELMKSEQTADKDRIAIAKDILDRAGMKTVAGADRADVKPENPYDALSVEELKALVKRCEPDGGT